MHKNKKYTSENPNLGTKKTITFISLKNSPNYNTHQVEEENDRISQLRSSADLRFHFRLSRAAAHAAVNLNDPQAAQAFSLQFSHFISHFLKNRGAAAVRSFHLSFHSPLVDVEAEFVEKCIDYAVKHGVESLRLDTVCHTEMWLPAAFFASETLLELELRQFDGGICVPEEFSFNAGEFFSFSESKEPFSGFPELEKLTLRQCTVYALAIIAPKLRALEIIQDEQLNEGMREISARYEGDFPLECWKINLPMLEEVYLDIHKKVTPAPNRRFENLPRNRDGCSSSFEMLRLLQ